MVLLKLPLFMLLCLLMILTFIIMFYAKFATGLEPTKFLLIAIRLT